jgi:aldehyde:ferredoxin oxidoreductase
MLGYHRRVALVDLSKGTVDYVQPSVTQLRDFIGGRGLGAALLSEHGATTEPLDPESVVCVMAGPLTGTDFPLANRLAFVFRSPLTRTIAWAMTGGYVATELKKGGIDGLIIRGRAADPCYVLIEGTRIEMCPAQLLWGMGAVECVTALQDAHENAHVLAIGPAGERLSPMATVINDKGRASGVRHGIGSVLGSKNLKAIVVRRSGAPKLEPVDSASYKSLLKRLHGKLRDSALLNPKTGALAVHGTPIAVEALGKQEALPTHNYRFTRLAHYEDIGGLKMTSTILRDRLTCAHCPVQCRREVGADGKYRYVTEGPDYAQLSSLGSNCDLTDLPALGYMNALCYELGLDPIEMGNTLALLAEATERGRVRDGLRWGDADRMIELIQLTGVPRKLGRVLTLGAGRAAATLGVPDLAMTVKNISIQNVDPRPEPAWGLLNATENFGAAAHIWSYADLVTAMEDAAVEPLLTRHSTAREVAEAVRYRQDLVAVLDSLTSCAFSSYAFAPSDYAEALSLVTGESFTEGALLTAGARIFAAERRYNSINGFTDADDTLPARFTHEGVPDGIHAGAVCDLDALLREYRRLRRSAGDGLGPDVSRFRDRDEVDGSALSTTSEVFAAS